MLLALRDFDALSQRGWPATESHSAQVRSLGDLFADRGQLYAVHARDVARAVGMVAAPW